MPTSVTCFKVMGIALMVAWANMTFAHALTDSGNDHKGHHAAHNSTAHDRHVHARKRETPAAEDHDLASDPSVFTNVEELIARYSATGDDHLIAQGWRAIHADLINPTPVTWLRAAWLAQAEHRFDLARAYLAGVLKVQPRNPQAWLLEASVAMVQADYAAAQHACTQVTLTLSPVVALACKLRVEQNPARRAQLLERVSQLPVNELDAPVAAWVRSAVGDAYFYAGEFDKAMMSHTSALTLNPTVQARAALADTLIALGRFAAAKALLNDYQAVPALGVRYVLTLTKAGHAPVAETKRLDTRFKTWIEQQDFRHAREMAMFYLDVMPDPDLALRLARENLRHQKEVEDRTILERAMAAATTHETGDATPFATKDR